MIKIQEHLNRADADAYLDSLALKMWNHLNQKLTNGKDYYANSLIRKLDKLLIESQTPEYLLDIANNDLPTLKRQTNFFTYLKNNNNSKLKDLVTSRPPNLLTLKEEIHNIFNQDDFFINNGGITQTPFGKKVISSLFNYSKFRKSKICPKLILDANLDNITCPYCNQNRIRVIDISTETDIETIHRAYLDVDHFYPKSQHPYFALSYYNLIPSCHDCNSFEKGDKEFCINTHLNPFYESINDNYFFEINDKTVIDGKSDYIKLNYIGNRIDYTDRDLKLNLRFQIYLDKVNQLVELYLNYKDREQNSPYNFDWLEAILQNVPREKHNILKKSTGKMLRDIIKQIDDSNIIHD